MGMGGLAYEKNDGGMRRIGDDDGMMEVEKIRTPEKKESFLKGAGYEEVVFDVESDYSGRRVSPTAGRQGPLHSIAKANTNAVRKTSACWRCKFMGEPVGQCLFLQKAMLNRNSAVPKYLVINVPQGMGSSFGMQLDASVAT